MLGCPRVIEMGWTGKAGYYAREREGGGRRWRGIHGKDGRRTDGEKRADEKRRRGGAAMVVRGGDTWREFTRGTTEGGGGNGCIMRREQGKDGGAHLTPME